jgi:hypothetical protein
MLALSSSQFDPYRKSAPGNGASRRVRSRSSTQCQIRQSSNRRTGLLAVEGPIRDDVFDLTARHADIHELQVVQAVQLGAFPLSFAPFFAPFLKRTPISPEEDEEVPRRSGRLG